VPAAEILDDRDQPIEPLEPFDGGRQHLHQLAPLFHHVALEHLPQTRIDFEQPVVKKHHGIVGDGGNRSEAGLDERDLCLGQHWMSPSAFGTQCDVSAEKS
jgi:hypothetical protein